MNPNHTTTALVAPLLDSLEPTVVERFLTQYSCFSKLKTCNLTDSITTPLLDTIKILNSEYKEESLLTYLEDLLKFSDFDCAHQSFLRLKLSENSQETALTKLTFYLQQFTKQKNKASNLKLSEEYFKKRFAQGIRPIELSRSLFQRIEADCFSSFEDLVRETQQELVNIERVQRLLPKPAKREEEIDKKVTKKWCSHCKMDNHNTSHCGYLLRAQKKQIQSSTSASINPKQIKLVSYDPDPVCKSFLKVPVEINGFKLMGTIDTAAEVSCISQNLIKTLNLSVSGSIERYITADQRVTNSRGSVTTALSLHGIGPAPKVLIHTTLMVLEGCDQILIGCDVLRRLGVMTDDSLMLKLNRDVHTEIDYADDDVLKGLNYPELCSVQYDNSNEIDEIKINLECENQNLDLKNILKNYQDVFSNVFPADGIKCQPMTIPFHNEEKTILRKPRPLNPNKLQLANEVFDELIEKGIARNVADPQHISPIVLIEYPNKKPRITGDYSGVNGVNENTITVPANLPLLSDIDAVLGDAKFIGTLDLPRAFYQVMIDEKDIPKTTISIPGRAIEFLRASFGLKNVPSFFQNVMVEIFQVPSNLSKVFIYIDDIIIAAKTFEEFLETIKFILQRAREFRVRLSGKTQSKIVGSIYKNGTRSIDPDRVDAIVKLPAPPNQTALRSFLGSVNFIREFIPKVSELTTPLTALLKNKTDYCWTQQCEDHFQRLKQEIILATSLSLPGDQDNIVVTTDASNNAVAGAVWIEEEPLQPSLPLHKRTLKPVAFFSKTLSKSQLSWSTIQKELYSIVMTLTQNSIESLLLSRHFYSRYRP
ncbi:hypothetical protein RCL1_002652 [Eukaryota sp. TZLM3-RCL]